EAEPPPDQEGRQGDVQQDTEVEEIRVRDHVRVSASLRRSALPLMFIRKLSGKENFRGIMYAGRRSINWTFSSEASWKSERAGRSFRITKAARESTAPCLSTGRTTASRTPGRARRFASTSASSMR